MKEVAIVSGSRTAIGTFGGGLKDVPVTQLGAVVMKDVLTRVNLRPVQMRCRWIRLQSSLKTRA